MPFGVTNAPAQSMHLLNDVLRDFLNTFVMVFVDDILVHSKSVEERAQHLRSVLEKLRQYQLFAKAPTCCFAVSEIAFLGQKVTPAGMSPTEEKSGLLRSDKDQMMSLTFGHFSALQIFIDATSTGLPRFLPLNAAHQERRSRRVGTFSEQGLFGHKICTISGPHANLS